VLKPSSSDHTKVHAIQDSEFFFHFDWKALRNRAVLPPFVPDDGSAFEVQKSPTEAETTASRALSPVTNVDALEDYRYDDTECQAEMKLKLTEMEHSFDKKYIARCVSTRERLIDRGLKFFSRGTAAAANSKGADGKAESRRGGLLRASNRWKLTLAAVQAFKGKGGQDDAEGDCPSTSRSTYSDAGGYSRSPMKDFVSMRSSMKTNGAEVATGSTVLANRRVLDQPPAPDSPAAASKSLLTPPPGSSDSPSSPYTRLHRLSISSVKRKDSVNDVPSTSRSTYSDAGANSNSSSKGAL
jgi:hypothetical protein